MFERSTQMTEDSKPKTKRTDEEEVALTSSLHGEHVIRSIIHMASFGISQRDIARSLKIPPTRIKAVLASSSVKQEVIRIQEELYSRDTKKMFMRMIPEAAAITYKMMKSKKSKDMTKLSAANMIMDRALGKPTQHVIEEKSELKDVFIKINERINSEESASRLARAEEVIETVGATVEEVKDPLDVALEKL